ncbi:MAG: hypothetical protein EAZ77_14660 [Nostocales cyanobacterium]|nr:MAG: hypothetical protein EAZ77_14660 [Nostocales cyanobacterium]
MNYCPCCSDLLLRHISSSHKYWFCRTCWQEMPVMSRNLSGSLAQAIIEQNLRKTPILAA